MGLNDFRNMSADEQKEAMKDYARRVDDTVGEKFRAIKGWAFKLLGGVVLLHGVIFLLVGWPNAGLGTSGVGITILGAGLRKISSTAQRVVICIGIVLLGSTLINYGLGQMEKAKQSAAWPSVPGKIVRSELEKRTTTEGTGNNKRTKTYYVAVIEYQYQVAGQAYTSDRISFGGQSRSRSSELVNTYPKGKSVTVTYNPDNAGEAVLETGLKKGGYFLPGFGAVLIVFGLLILFKGRRKVAANG